MNINTTRNNRRCCRQLLERVEVRNDLKYITGSKSTTASENSVDFFLCVCGGQHTHLLR